MYKRLQVLEEQGFVETYEVENGERKKKMYELTAIGWDELRKWLVQPSEYPIVKDELLLKMGAWGQASPEDVSPLLDHLHTRKIKSQQLLNFYERWSENGFSSIDGYAMLVIEYVKSRLKAELGWIDFAVKRLQSAPLPPVQDPFGLIPQQQVRRQKAMKQANAVRQEGN